MTGRELWELRRLIDARRRELVRSYCQGETGTIYENPETGYRNGCRCDWCKAGTVDARYARQRRREARLSA